MIMMHPQKLDISGRPVAKKASKIHVSEQEIGFFWLNSRPSLHQNI